MCKKKKKALSPLRCYCFRIMLIECWEQCWSLSPGCVCEAPLCSERQEQSSGCSALPFLFLCIVWRSNTRKPFARLITPTAGEERRKPLHHSALKQSPGCGESGAPEEGCWEERGCTAPVTQSALPTETHTATAASQSQLREATGL